MDPVRIDVDKRARDLLISRSLQALAIGRGDLAQSLAYVEGRHDWSAKGPIVSHFKGAISSMNLDDAGMLPPTPVGEAVGEALRSYSVPRALAASMRTVMPNTRTYTNSTAAATSATVGEGKPIPVLKGNWQTSTLDPSRGVKSAGIVVVTDELMRSGSATAISAIKDDLLAAIGDAESRAFVDPNEATSILYGAPHFNGTGTTISAILNDLQREIGLVPATFKPGAAFAMCMESATFLGTLYGSGGAPAFPDIGPQGGKLLGLPVIISAACADEGSPPTRIVALVAPSEIFWASGGVMLTASRNAALQMDNAPTGDSKAPTSTSIVSMFQTDSTALKGEVAAAWYGRANCAAYFVSGY